MISTYALARSTSQEFAVRFPVLQSPTHWLQYEITTESTPNYSGYWQATFWRRMRDLVIWISSRWLPQRRWYRSDGFSAQKWKNPLLGKIGIPGESETPYWRSEDRCSFRICGKILQSHIGAFGTICEAMNDIICKKWLSAVNECRTHLIRIHQALDRLANRFPLTRPAYDGLDEQDIASVCE